MMHNAFGIAASRTWSPAYNSGPFGPLCRPLSPVLYFPHHIVHCQLRSFHTHNIAHLQADCNSKNKNTWPRYCYLAYHVPRIFTCPLAMCVDREYHQIMRLNEWMKENSKSIRAVAEGTGLNFTTIWRILTGRVRPDSSTVKKISEYTKGRVNFDDLV